ncbi:hypothetical protein RCH16_001218 [Cryobacterium sp. MP_M5]|uniref:hypothetical protein n=1 Tax=unclassified Cryobacterium TaxID=2649013 RepID=UPI0018C9AD88|nr:MULTISPECIES: hypothetical protein [unclassified Cryobacterium]MBG6058020.1 hypothetical protein [Cryobacterium sp. MP_M3]MEC5176219.1 hypothetical protein [Cryobacterium sp. MP_M5]
MNTTLSTTPGRHDHPPQPRPEQAPERPQPRPRRVGPIDRLALHVGVALIKWGRRPGAVRTPAPIAVEAEEWETALRVREERERAVERLRVDLLRYRMTVPFR